MAHIKYVVLSDFHAGAVGSLATALDLRTKQPLPHSGTRTFKGVAVALSWLLQAYNEQVGRPKFPVRPEDAPQLILLGDIFDFSFADRAVTVETVCGVLNYLRGPPASRDKICLFNENLLAVPGNHDHALWTGARLAHEAEAIGRRSPGGLPSATPAFSDGLPSPLLDAVGRRIGLRGQARLHYPNLGLRSADGRKAIVLHHGHFIEALYRALSSLYDILAGRRRESLTVAELAAENANWIEFGWSTLGNATGFAERAATFYEYLETGSAAQAFKDRTARSLERWLTAEMPMGGERRVQHIVRMALQVAIDASFEAVSDEERYAQIEYLRPATLAGLEWYLREPTRRQLVDELGAVPDQVAFVFGHTHKPFVDQIAVAGYPNPVAVCNTGGWFLDAPRLDGREGAAMVLIDDDLNAVAVRLFNTDSAASSGQCALITAPDDNGRAFHADVAAAIEATARNWSQLGQSAQEDYAERQRLILRNAFETDRRDDMTGGLP